MKLKKTLAAIAAILVSASALTIFPASAEETADKSKIVWGDANLDGAVNIMDVILVNKSIYGKATLSPQGILNADINQSNAPDATDALNIMKLAVKLTVDLPAIPSETELKDDGDVLHIVCWTDNDLKNMIEVYQEDNPDAKVEWKQCGTFGSDASAKYATFLNSGEDVDLFIAESGWILQYIDDDKFSAPLSALGITEADYADAYSYTVDIGTDKKGILKGASWQAAPGGFCYNATLAEQYLGVASPEEMQAKINDWDGFTATAEQLKIASESTVKMTATLEGMWQCFASAINSPWIINGSINTETARNFADMAVQYVQNDYVDPTITQWSSYWENAGKDGETLGYFYSTWCLTAGNQLEQNCGTEGNWRIVRGPQEYFWGGSWLCVSPNCDNKTEAEKFVRYFTVDDASMEKYALKSGDFVNNQSVMAKIVSDGSNQNPLLGGQDQFSVLKDVAANIKMNETITEYDQDLKESFMYALSANVYGGDADEIVNDFLSQAAEKHPELFQDDKG